MSYELYVHIILNELLRAHYNFLGPLRKAWKSHDEYNNGFMTRSQIEGVLEEVDVDHSFSPASLAEDIDQEELDLVTYSSLVKYLAEKTTGENGEVSLLQFFYDKHN